MNYLNKSRRRTMMASVAAVIVLGFGGNVVVEPDPSPTSAARGEAFTGLIPAQHVDRLGPPTTPPPPVPAHIGPVGKDFDNQLGLLAYASGTTTTTIAHAARPRADRGGQRSTVTTDAPPVTAVPEPAPEPVEGEGRWIGSSAYCLTGRMANGKNVHNGAVASTVLPRGTTWRVVEGKGTGNTYTVEDTGGPRATFDIWMASCDAAVAYGRPRLRIVQVAG